MNQILATEPKSPQVEKLNRGFVASRMPDGRVMLSWRMLGDDPTDLSFDIYREAKGQLKKLNDIPIIKASCWQDDTSTEQSDKYVLGVNSTSESKSNQLIKLEINTLNQPLGYLSIPLQTPTGYTPNDASVADLDGDGTYEIILHQVGTGRDNSQTGYTTPPIFEAYKLTGQFLWRINLGHNIREGAHYNPFLVYDFDGDGKAEFVCRTADGTLDGAGRILGDPFIDYRRHEGQALGRILDGPEFLSVFDGMTGKELKSVPFEPARGDVRDWGDNYGNRCDRFLACVAYLDGQHPSIVMTRGYYQKTMLTAWDWNDGQLKKVWTFDSDDGTPGNINYRGQGNHNIAVADVDEDGRDEIIYGSCVIDDNGKGLYSTGYGHGDAMHVTDIDPDTPGLEVFKANGDTQNAAGIHLRSARDGKTLFQRASTGDEGIVRACAFDIDPEYPGLEFWGKGAGVQGILFSAKGKVIPGQQPNTCNMGVWWDGDLNRELLSGTKITKWNYLLSEEVPLFEGRSQGCISINGTKSNPCLCADIIGDWREELIVATQAKNELRIYLTPFETDHKMTTLMQDHVYRLSVASQNAGYNQPSHPGFYLGTK